MLELAALRLDVERLKRTDEVTATRLEGRVTKLESDLERIEVGQSKYVTLVEFTPVRLIAYGLIAAMVPVVTAIVLFFSLGAGG